MKKLTDKLPWSTQRIKTEEPAIPAPVKARTAQEMVEAQKEGEYSTPAPTKAMVWKLQAVMAKYDPENTYFKMVIIKRIY